VKLLFDQNLSPKVARAINELIRDDRSQAIPLRDKFSMDTADTVWIAELGKEAGWAVISGDRAITKNKAERAAWLETDLVGFFLEPAFASLDPMQQTWRLIRWLPTLEKQLTIIHGPALFALPINSTSRLRQL
jgi:hypothetical protein